MNAPHTTVFIVDDCDVIKFGLSAALKSDTSFEIVGNAGNGASAIEKIEELKPNIVLLDWNLPDMQGIDVLRKIKASCPETKVIMLTVRDQPEAALEAFDAGADGFCTKGVRMEWLNAGVKTVSAGGTWLGPMMVQRVLSRLQNNNAEQNKPQATNVAALQRGPLSAREQQVIDLLVQGMSNNEIAERLYLSSETVKTHVRHIMEKLAVRDRTHAAVEAVRRGLVSAC